MPLSSEGLRARHPELMPALLLAELNCGHGSSQMSLLGSTIISHSWQQKWNPFAILALIFYPEINLSD